MKTTVLLSGGLDSTVLAAQLVAEGHDVHALSVWYGQRHDREVEAAERVAEALEMEWEIIELPERLLHNPNSSQSGLAAVPEGRYDDESMKTTVVPNRNMVLLSIAVARAIAQGSFYVAYAAHSGDHAIYPDCRPLFISAMGQAISLCDWKPPVLITPFVHKTKADIVSLGVKLAAPLALTWSCYKGEDRHCGRCGTCVERLEAFWKAGQVDPVAYTDNDYWKEVIGS